ncbi:BON domain-containing protein [uncultured Psychrosphaera sp.]|jgi:osmotically-inducible protein OsmY|uniref:BON domain-containing protein n=1 Tax=uncultured Psychrosphaera sp. TaxID=1403522 RepID=UPI00261D98B3|nr:BON domain-containing protein [uncultured Psychrosphaera sp.]
MKNLLYPLTLISVLTAGSAYAGDEWKPEIQDAWLDGKAETTILLNKHLNSFDINTDVKNGVVYLTGEVNSQIEKSLAGELITNLDGVKTVENKLVILPESTQSQEVIDKLTDAKVETVVKTKLLMHPDVSGTNIEVETENKVVTLTGHVDSEEEKELAAEVVKGTEDIESIVNNLSVTQ